MPGGWVYIMTNQPNGTLYVGTTTDLARCVRGTSREGVADGFTKRYGLTRLVYAERHDDILVAKQREMNIKHQSRAWKVRPILKENLNWDDLYDKII
jgi:putative endonuclease